MANSCTLGGRSARERRRATLPGGLQVVDLCSEPTFVSGSRLRVNRPAVAASIQYGGSGLECLLGRAGILRDNGVAHFLDCILDECLTSLISLGSSLVLSKSLLG